GPECAPTKDSPALARGLYDLGSRHDYLAALIVDASPALVSFNSADGFFTLEDNTALTVNKAKSADDPRAISLGGTSEAPFVTAPLITVDDADALQSNKSITDIFGRGELVRLETHVRLRGTTQQGADVLSQWLTVPVDLCAGCLTAAPLCLDDDGTPQLGDDFTVPAIPNHAVCFIGNDVPALVCPGASP
ncbi:MAG TPA: hypothetical protein VGO62_09890, partial [Myxococcota bacterium]